MFTFFIAVTRYAVRIYSMITNTNRSADHYLILVIRPWRNIIPLYYIDLQEKTRVKVKITKITLYNIQGEANKTIKLINTYQKFRYNNIVF